MRQHGKMCQIVGSVVYSLVEAGRDTHRKNIATVLCNGLTVPGNGIRSQNIWPTTR